MSRPVIDSSEFLSALAASPIFLDYQQAFRTTTGLRLFLAKPDAILGIERDGGDARSSCALESALTVPVHMGGRKVAYLHVPGLLARHADTPTLEQYAESVLASGASAEEVDEASLRYAKLSKVSQETLNGLQTMLSMFASQLSDYADKLFLQHNFAEPMAVQRAKDYILRHLQNPLTLEAVADHAGVSIFHFCKIFKKATGLTFIEFVNRARVEQAKRLLLRPNSRITEIAYDVGFQSLSQFNRSFRRVVSVSPTEYRSGMAHRFLARKNVVKLS